MNKIKKAGILAGAVAGGLVGGTISLIGKMSKVKIIDDIGESVVDSAILTGTMAGTAASGTADILTGKLKKNDRRVKAGIDDLKDTGRQVADNFVGNFRLVAGSGGQIADGVRRKNLRKIKKGVTSLVKILAVGFITVGAIRVKEDSEDSGSR